MARKFASWLGHINIGASKEGADNPLTRLRIPSPVHSIATPPNDTSSFDMFSNDDNNFAGAAFGYPIQGNDNSDPNCYHFEETSGCPFEVTNCYPIEATGGCPIGVTDGVPFACAALTSGLDLGPLTDFSTSELEQWCMPPEFGSQMDFFSDAAGFNIGEFRPNVPISSIVNGAFDD